MFRADGREGERGTWQRSVSSSRGLLPARGGRVTRPTARAPASSSGRRAASVPGALAAATVVVLGVELLSLVGWVRLGPMAALAVLSARALAAVYRSEAPEGRGAPTRTACRGSSSATWFSSRHRPRDRRRCSAVLLTYVVSGRNDLLANLPQWLAGVGSAVVAMETTRVLGGDRRTRLLAALVVTPLVDLESSSTQTISWRPSGLRSLPTWRSPSWFSPPHGCRRPCGSARP